jgi:Protein of unknown function (DUF3667)
MHGDRSVLALLRSLLLRPGFVAREYVFGKRRRYFGPFATLVILLGVSTLLSELVRFESITSRPAVITFLAPNQRCGNRQLFLRSRNST